MGQRINYFKNNFSKGLKNILFETIQNLELGI